MKAIYLFLAILLTLVFTVTSVNGEGSHLLDFCFPHSSPKTRIYLNFTSSPSWPDYKSYIVIFIRTVPQDIVDAAEAKVLARGGTIMYRYSTVIKGFAATLTDDLYGILEANPWISYIEADSIGKFFILFRGLCVNWPIEKRNENIHLADHAPF